MSEHAEDENGGGEPHPLQDEDNMELPADTLETNDENAVFDNNEGDADFDDTEVGHEVAPPREGPDEDDVGYYAHLHPAEEDLADNVASDVRAPPAASLDGDGEEVQPDFEALPVPAEADDGGAEGEEAAQRLASADADTATSPSLLSAPATSNTAVRQPTQGTQVDAEVDIQGAEADAAAEQGRVPVSAAIETTVSPAAAATAPLHTTPSARSTTAAPVPASSAAAAGGTPAAALPPPAKAAAAVAPPSWSQLPQSPHGTAEVTVTVLPIRAVARLQVPVSSPSSYRPTGAETTAASAAAPSAEGGGGGREASPHWVLVAKDLYEGIAKHLLIHPTSFRIYHQHKRLRFMGTLFLDCDVTSAPGTTSAVNNRAEPIWVSVAFPVTEANDEVGGAGGASSGLLLVSATAGTSSHTTSNLNTEEEEAHASVAAVPSHLCQLGPEDFVARCIRVRPRKLEVPPRTLVEGRRQGYTYDQVIMRMQAVQNAEQIPASHGGRGENTATGSPGASVAPNFSIVALIQDSPVPPSTPFLGGYRDKHHPDRVRLHAATQLYHRDLEYSPFAGTSGHTGGAAKNGRCTRHTQTIGVSRGCQTHREACVQTPRVDLHLEESHDFVVVARPYFTAAELQVLRTEMAVMIQKMYRQWKARRVREFLEQAEAARQHRAGARQRREEALLMAVEDAAQLRRDDPRSAADFERVKQDIIDWRADEAARIQRDPSLSPAEIRAALLALTETELQLLQQLDQRRRDVGKTQTEKRFVQTLQRMAAPKQWGPVHVRTPETERAAELRDLYERLCLTSGGQTAATAKALAATASANQGHGIGEGSVEHLTSSPGSVTPGQTGSMRSNTATSPWLIPNSGAAAATSVHGSVASVSASQQASGTYSNNNNLNISSNAAVGLSSATAARLDILLRVKWTVREFSEGSAQMQELCELIDREADLLHRGRKGASLSSLRRRIQSLFAQFIEDPRYNPVVKEFARTARDRARVKEVERLQEKATARKSQTTTAA